MEITMFARGREFVSCNNADCIISDWGGCSKQIITTMIDTKKNLEQSEICCTEWEKQALDYKAENIGLQSKLDIAVDALKWIAYDENGEQDGLEEFAISQMMEKADEAINQITTLEQKDNGGNK